MTPVFPLLADVESPERVFPCLQSVFPCGGKITAVESMLGGIEIALRVCHQFRRRLFGLHLPGSGERLPRVAHLLHRCARASAQRRHKCDWRGEAQSAGRDVMFGLQGNQPHGSDGVTGSR